jgi:hypothetical protein
MSDISGIIGTLSGFIVAFAADPIKNVILNLINVRLLRKAIYCELIGIYDRAFTFIHERESLYTGLDTTHIRTISDIFELFIQLDKGIFFYAKKQQPLLFYRLEEAPIVSMTFSEIHYYQRLEKEHIQDPDTINSTLIYYATILNDSFEKLFRNKAFDRHLLLKLSRGLKCHESLKCILRLPPVRG